MLINENGVTREMTPQEIAEVEAFNNSTEGKAIELMQLREFLSSTDYVACKIGEGSATKEEYADIIEKRQEARARINQLS